MTNDNAASTGTENSKTRHAIITVQSEKHHKITALCTSTAFFMAKAVSRADCMSVAPISSWNNLQIKKQNPEIGSPVNIIHKKGVSSLEVS